MGISRKEHDAAGEDTAASWTPGENARLLRAARLVIDVYGGDAASYAVTRAALLRNMGDVMGATAWLRVQPFIEELQRAGKLKRRAEASIKGRAPARSARRSG